MSVGSAVRSLALVCRSLSLPLSLEYFSLVSVVLRTVHVTVQCVNNFRAQCENGSVCARRVLAARSVSEPLSQCLWPSRVSLFSSLPRSLSLSSSLSVQLGFTTNTVLLAHEHTHSQMCRARGPNRTRGRTYTLNSSRLLLFRRVSLTHRHTTKSTQFSTKLQFTSYISAQFSADLVNCECECVMKCSAH